MHDFIDTYPYLQEYMQDAIISLYEILELAKNIDALDMRFYALSFVNEQDVGYEAQSLMRRHVRVSVDNIRAFRNRHDLDEDIFTYLTAQDALTCIDVF